MIRSGKCPGCQKVPATILIETANGQIGIVAQAGYKVVTYLCSSCRTILSVQMDPIALKADIVNEAAKKITGR